LIIICYVRVSTQDQNAELQVDALEKSGCEQVSQEKLTGKLREDLGRRSAFVRSGGGNVLIVLKLARSLKGLAPWEYKAKHNRAENSNWRCN